MDDFVLGRYRLMRRLLSEIGLHDKVLLDIGAWSCTNQQRA